MHGASGTQDRHETVAAMDRHWWYRGRRTAVGSLLRRAGARPVGKERSIARADEVGGRAVRPGRPPRSRPLVLDYGCGVGNMGATLARYGDVWGVEADRDALAAGDFSTYAGVVCSGSVAEAIATGAVPRAAFDVVTCLDVLEHVEDDGGLLHDLAALLSPGGVMIVSAPLHPELYCTVDEIAGHVRRYTADGLRGLIDGAGLRMVAESGYVVGLLPLARRQRRRVQTGRAAPEQEWAVPSAPVNAVLSAVAMAEGEAARWVALPAGLSLLIAGRRVAGVS